MVGGQSQLPELELYLRPCLLSQWLGCSENTKLKLSWLFAVKGILFSYLSVMLDKVLVKSFLIYSLID